MVGCDALLLGERVAVSGIGVLTSSETTTVAVCLVYSDLPVSYRPPAHPCYERSRRISAAADPETRKKLVRDTPPECLQLNPPVIEVSARATKP